MWLTAFLDVPAEVAEAESTFWEAVTATSRSAARGDHGEFWSLQPDDGDPVLRVQRLADGPARMHVDLHADDPDTARRRAGELGAELLAEPGWTVHRSPGGLVFCIVGAGPSRRPGALSLPHASRLDQLCLDVPADRYDAETAFWCGLLRRELRPSPGYAEFARLESRAGDSFRVLVQRVGDADDVRIHLDLATDDRTDEVERMVALGAHEVRRTAEWTTLQDPAGLPFCVTDRDPAAPWGAG
jgi:hypothetical protein